MTWRDWLRLASIVLSLVVAVFCLLMGFEGAPFLLLLAPPFVLMSLALTAAMIWGER